MNVPQLLENLAQRVASDASVKQVYGDPVTVGDRTVIPAAQVRYAFGGGGGGGKPNGEEAGGGGGGGRVAAQPCGALEITPQGTRFIPFDDWRKTAAALALGFLLGAAVMALSSQKTLPE